MVKTKFTMLLAVLVLITGLAFGNGADDKGSEKEANRVIKQLMGYKTTDPNQEPPVALIEELTGYTLEFYTLPAEGADEKLNIELSTGVEYDLVSLSRSQFYSLLSKGALQDMNPHFAETAPNLERSFTPEEWNTAAYGEGIFGIPQFDALYVGSAIGVHQEVMENLDMTAPRTPQELKSLLSAVKENTDMIPLTGKDYLFIPIASGFGVANEWVAKDSNLVPRITTDEFKAYISFMAELYAEELLDPEWPINTGENVDEKFTSGRAFASDRAWWNAVNINKAVMDNTGNTVKYVPLLEMNGRSYNPVNIGPKLGFHSIPKSCKDITKAMSYLNARHDPENLRPIFLGREGVQHEVRTGSQGNDSYWPIFPAFKEWFNGHYFTVGLPSKMYTTLWLCRVKKSEEMYDAFAKINDVGDAHVPDPLSFAPPMENVAKYTQSCEQLARDFFIEVIYGTKNMDDDYDAFMDKWLSEGGQEMIDDVNAWK